MSGFRTVLKRVRVGVEPNGSAAIDLSDTISDLDDLRVTTASATPMQEVLPDESIVQSIHQRRQVRKGFRSGQVDLSGILVPPAAELAAGTTPALDALGLLFKVGLGGGATFDAGSAVVASPAPTTTTFSITLAGGGDLIEGQLIAVETTATSERFEVAMVKDVTDDAVTLCHALSFTPVTAAKVLNMENFFATQGLPSATESHQFLVEGEGRDHSIYNYLGCQGPLTFEWELGKFPTWSLSATAMTWLKDDEIATPQGGAALAVATMPGGSPIPITNSAIIISPIAGTLRTLPDIAECKWENLGSTWQIEASYNGVQGKAQQVMVPGPQPTCSVLVRAVDETWIDGFDAGTKYRVLASAGNTGAGLIAMAFGTCELIARPVIESPNGIEYWRLVFGALMNEDAGTQSTSAASGSTFVIARG